jgi:hypothetical protein
MHVMKYKSSYMLHPTFVELIAAYEQIETL